MYDALRLLAISMLLFIGSVPIADAATPCRDVPRFETLRCRAASLAELLEGLDGRLERGAEGLTK